jgi:hypothetical protein
MKNLAYIREILISVIILERTTLRGESPSYAKCFGGHALQRLVLINQDR